MKLLLAVPTYGPTDPQANRHLRVAIMHAARHGVEWVGDLSPDKMKFDDSRNTVVKGALEAEDAADAILWVDSDVLLPPHAITDLVKAGRDFITGMYFQRRPPHWPLIAFFNTREQSFNWCSEWPTNAIAPVDGCGFGIVLTSVTMLRAMAPPWFTFEKFSEDFDFCRRAKAAGFQLFVHTGVQCGHLPEPEAITADDFRQLRDSGGLERYQVRPVRPSAASGAA